MRGDLVNLNFIAFNKQSSGLIVKCFGTLQAILKNRNKVKNETSKT